MSAPAVPAPKGTVVPAPSDAEEVIPPKLRSKKLLLIVALAVVLIGGAVAGWMFMSPHSAHPDEGDVEEVVADPEAPKGPPTFLPLENMVVNLADPGGARMAQIGITIEMADAKSAEQVKVYLPSIRSGILMLISQRTSAEMLQREGKEKLAQDILQEVSRPLGVAVEGHVNTPSKKGGAAAGKKKYDASGPVQNILFSSFIVQ